jgi:hypothetical protein
VKARYLYPLLFLLPGAMLALLVAVGLTATGAGVLWIFVYGDNPWPESAHTMLMVVAAMAFILTLTTLLGMSYSFGKKREVAGGLHWSHVWAAVGLSVGVPLLVLLHQWQVGNL